LHVHVTTTLSLAARGNEPRVGVSWARGINHHEKKKEKPSVFCV
jgi:hypothetical protein